MAGPVASIRRRPGETRALIVAGAVTCLRSRRLRDLRVEEVMDAAGPGLSRTLFYRHFDDMIDLVLQVSAEAMSTLLDRQRDLLAGATSLEEGLHIAYDALGETFERQGPLIRAVVDAAAVDRRAEAVFDHVLSTYVDFARTVLELHGLGEAASETARALVRMDMYYLLDCYGVEPRVERSVVIDTLSAVWVARCRPAG